MAKTIVIKQIGSPIRRPAKQRATLIGLGSEQNAQTRELEDTPSVRGMVEQISTWSRSSKKKGKLRSAPSGAANAPVERLRDLRAKLRDFSSP